MTVACARPGSPGVKDPPTSDAPASAQPPSSSASSAVPPEALEQAMADAAYRAGVELSDVRVVSAEAVTWSDGSLGCPRSGQMYTQALAPGYRVVLDVDGEEMTFHAGDDAALAFCADPQPPVGDSTVDR